MLREKIKQNKRGILLYGLTPSKENIAKEKVEEVAKRRLKRLENSGIDGLVIYDLQDESNRNKEERTFDFVKNISPEIYHKKYLHEAYPAIIYKATGNYTKEEFSHFCKNESEESLSVFVGASSKDDKPKLSLNEAYDIRKKSNPRMSIGGICIAERHIKKGDEHLRIASKILKGCEFFITQTVYNLENAKKLIDDYASLDVKKVPIIFTFTPCGTLKTLHFMRWLNISVPTYFEKRLFSADNPLKKSSELSLELFDFLYAYGKAKGISVGANVESISVKKEEVEESIILLRGIKSIIDSDEEYIPPMVRLSASRDLD